MSSYGTLSPSMSTTSTNENTLYEEDMPVALVPNLPSLKFHSAPYFFMCEAGISQQEYQQRVLENEHLVSDLTNDLITIKCPNLSNGTGQIFRFERFVLNRSPFFASFLKDTENYVPGCHLHLTFTVDPAAVLELAYEYLKFGADVFDNRALKVWLFSRYKPVDRIIILVKLHAFAYKMQLRGLTAMVENVLDCYMPTMNIENTIIIANLVFSKSGIFEVPLKDWVFGHVKRWYKYLTCSTFWLDSMSKADAELTKRWEELVEQMTAKLEPVDEGSDDVFSESDDDETMRLLEGRAKRRSTIYSLSNGPILTDFINRTKPDTKPENFSNPFSTPQEKTFTLPKRTNNNILPISPESRANADKAFKILGEPVPSPQQPRRLSKSWSGFLLNRSSSFAHSPPKSAEKQLNRMFVGQTAKDKEDEKTWRRASISSFGALAYQASPTRASAAGRRFSKVFMGA
ncbi:MAG: hypothetical protein Q9174_002516 [Haloplaca sp. 1 TL-2023]